ncbi:MAG: hypothetical protein KJ571_08805 [Bacteroidetes bacterium]|nr:hypothetical protein [Bacteroidota bacterium]
MNDINFKIVKSKSDLKEFIKFAWKIYKNEPFWVPPLVMDKLNLLDKEKNPFFKHAEIELYIAYRNGEAVGRIAAIKNDLHNKIHNDNVGFFGFYECINDTDVSVALLDKAKTWLKEKGFSEMRGPANPSSNDEWGLLLEGFDDSPRILMPYNPKYYITLLESYGLKKVKDLYAYKLENKKVLSSEKLKRVADIAKQRAGVTVRAMNKKDFNNELEKFKYVYNKAWAPNWGFVPLTDAEIDHMAKDLKPLIDPNLVLYVEKNGETVGAALVMPDYNFIIKKLNGKLFPFGFLKLLTQNKKISWARVITLGLIPEFQKKGLDAVLYYEIVNRAAQRGIYFGEASWVLEDNEMMKRGAEVMNGELYKKYRVFEINI